MTSADIVRLIDSIARDKEIDKEGLFQAIEQAVAQAIARKYGVDDLELKLNRGNGQWICNYEISLEEQGRIMAQAVKQTILGKVREAERDVLYQEYERKLGEIASGTVQRFEGGSVIVNLGRNMEGILPQAEKVRTENYNIGDRIRALVLEVKKVGPRVKVILSRAHRDLVRALFELEVPEIADGTIVIRRIEREPGYRTKLAVHSADPKVDCVGACVGVRGTRIKSIIDELNNERIDIIRWNDDPQTLITNALKPAEISHIELDHENRKALVLVGEEQLSLAIGRKGQNVRLASKLTGWEIDIMTRAELEKSVADEDAAAAAEPGDEQDEAEDQEAAAGEQAVAEPAAEEPVGAAPAGAEPPAEEPIAQEPARAASGAASGSSGAAAGKAADAPGRTQDDENTAGSVAQS
jgi:N utilization substance protein A